MIQCLIRKKVRGGILEYIVTGKEMKLLDQNTSEFFHMPTVVLMEQAADSFVRKLIDYIKTENRILIVC